MTLNSQVAVELAVNASQEASAYFCTLLPAGPEGEGVWLADRPPSPGLPVLGSTLSPTLSACPLK